MSTAPAAPIRLVTIVAESVLQERIEKLVLEAGATGFTSAPCSGQGSRGLRAIQPIGDQNVRIETLVARSTAAAIMDRLSRDYFPHYAVIAWTSDVDVLRGAKYGG